MTSPQKEFNKTKTLLPDGRYLIYYDFGPEPRRETQKQNQIKPTEGEANV